MKKGEVSEYGGTLTNNEYRFKSLVSVSHKNPLTKNMKFNQNLIDTINKMASTEYTINQKVLSITTEKEFILKGNKKLIHFKSHKETEFLSKFVKEKTSVR